MNSGLTKKNRKEIKTKMAAVFNEKIKSLTSQYQAIILDDLVTAFENRLNTMRKANLVQTSLEVANFVELETV